MSPTHPEKACNIFESLKLGGELKTIFYGGRSWSGIWFPKYFHLSQTLLNHVFFSLKRSSAGVMIFTIWLRA